MEENSMKNSDLPTPTNDNQGSLLTKSDNLSYYSSYSDSFFSENAIPIEPKQPPKNSVRRSLYHMPSNQPNQQNTNPRNQSYKFKARKNPFHNENSQIIESSLTKQQLASLKENALNRKRLSISLPEDYRALKADITKTRNRYVTQHNYEKADEYQKALEYVAQCEMKTKNNELYKTKSRDISRKETTFKASLDKFDEDTKQQREKLQQDINDHRAKLQEKHQNEVQSFEERWNGQAKQKQYSQPSHALSSLRRQLNFMLTQCRYEDAREVQKQIVERVKFEKDENSLQMKIDFNEAFKKLSLRQAEEKQFFEESSQLKLTNFEQRRKRERLGFENREKKLVLEREVANPDNIRKPKSSRANVTRITKPTMWEKEYEQLPLPRLSSSKAKRQTVKAKKSKP